MGKRRAPGGGGAARARGVGRDVGRCVGGRWWVRVGGLGDGRGRGREERKAVVIVREKMVTRVTGWARQSVDRGRKW